jgi:uncharacterized membrane protein
MAQANNRRTGGRVARGRGRLGVAAAVAVVLAATLVIVLRGGADGALTGGAALIKDADLVIPVGEISTTARFYPVEMAGTLLEVIAVEAPDGTIRTAFNTCQVCYDSGNGYYKQEGDVLVCQNCGNRFRMDQVEVQSGGCNPVPIFPQNKTLSGENITISREFLTEATVIFSNWKTGA